MGLDARPDYTFRLMHKDASDECSPPANTRCAARILGARERVRLRTRELALIAGHAPPHVSQANYEQAKREVTGETDADRQETMLDSSNG